MKKRITALTLAIVMVMGTVALAAGTEKTISVTAMNMTINGQAVTPTKSNGEAAEVFAYDGATYVPLRYLSELLGIQVEWDKDSPNTAKLVDMPTGLKFNAGTYTGTAQGNNGPVSVNVTFSEDRILSVELGEHHETYYLIPTPQKVIPAAIVEHQSLAVDTVSGVTMSSRAIINAVADAVKQAGADPEALRVPIDKGAATQTTENCDVLVVGAGLAGLTAAIRLKSEGLNVILVEQLGIVGGNCIFSTGNFFGPMKEEDIDTCVKTWTKQTSLNTPVPPQEGLPNMNKVEKIIHDSVRVVDYFENELGFDMCLTTDYTTTSADVTKYMLRPTAEYERYSSRGSQICFALRDKYLEQGGDLRLNTKATELLKDEKGAIKGAVCSVDNGTLTINAKAVIMATGSITQNPEMLKKYWPMRSGDWFSTSVGSTGTGLEMMLDQGAVMWDTWVTGTILVHDTPYLVRTTVDGTQVRGVKSAKALHVNTEGKRLINENHSREGEFYTVPDKASVLIEIMDTPLLEEVGRMDEFEAKASEKGPFYKADTIEELAEQMGMEPAVLRATVERYNGFCKNGEDEDFGKPAGSLIAIDEGPYYAVVDTLVGFDITGGVKTDINARVLNADGNAINGLYAVGLASSRDFFSTAYVGGGSLLIGATMGITAAEDAASYIGK